MSLPYGRKSCFHIVFCSHSSSSVLCSFWMVFSFLCHIFLSAPYRCINFSHLFSTVYSSLSYRVFFQPLELSTMITSPGQTCLTLPRWPWQARRNGLVCFPKQVSFKHGDGSDGGIFGGSMNRAMLHCIIIIKKAENHMSRVGLKFCNLDIYIYMIILYMEHRHGRCLQRTTYQYIYIYTSYLH